MKTAPEIQAELVQFSGTENYYRHWLGFLYTDGVKWLCDNARCYWLIDTIMAYQRDPLVTKDPALQEHQFWRLHVNPDRSATLYCDRDTGNTAFSHKVELTDFPLDEVDLWMEGGVLILPGEH